MLPLTSAGCLITDHRQFEVVDYPPSIVPSVSATILPNQIKTFSVDDFRGPDGGLSELRLDVVVRDPNVEQLLHANTIVNRPALEPNPLRRTEDVRPTDSVDRPYTATVPASDLRMPGCNKIEVWVSSDFLGARAPRASNPDDIASITYWVAVSDGTPIDTAECPQ